MDDTAQAVARRQFDFEVQIDRSTGMGKLNLRNTRGSNRPVLGNN